MTAARTFCVWARVLLLVAVATVGAAMPTTAGANAVDEEKAAKVKSAYLVNFLRFSEWPASAFERTNDPVIITVLGQDPLGHALDAVAGEAQVGERAVAVRRLAWPERRDYRNVGDYNAAVAQIVKEIQLGHLLLVGNSLRDEGDSILAALSGSPVLTVGEGQEWMRLGAALALELERGKIVFYANRRVIKSSQINVSSRLLTLAKLYER